jgi:hypothetical protein
MRDNEVSTSLPQKLKAINLHQHEVKGAAVMLSALLGAASLSPKYRKCEMRFYFLISFVHPVSISKNNKQNTHIIRRLGQMHLVTS